MKSKLMETDAQGGRPFVLIFDMGEEAVAGLEAFAGENGVDSAQVTAIGALERGVVAWLNWETKAYEPVRVDEQCEVISVLGEIERRTHGRRSRPGTARAPHARGRAHGNAGSPASQTS